MDSKEANTCRIYTCHDKVGANVALVAKQVLLEHRHAGYDTGFAASRECVQLELRGDQRGGKLSVGSCAGSCTPDLRGDVMQFLAVLRWLLAVCF